jgi:hypothetical protein
MIKDIIKYKQHKENHELNNLLIKCRYFVLINKNFPIQPEGNKVTLPRFPLQSQDTVFHLLPVFIFPLCLSPFLITGVLPESIPDSLSVYKPQNVTVCSPGTHLPHLPCVSLPGPSPSIRANINHHPKCDVYHSHTVILCFFHKKPLFSIFFLKPTFLPPYQFGNFAG